MNKFAAGLSIVVALAGAAVVFLQRENNAELRDEITALRAEVQLVAKQQADAAGRLRAEAAASRQAAPSPAEAVAANRAGDEQRAELAKLREEMNALKKNTQEVARVAQAAQQAAKGESPLPVKLTAVGELKNAGKATASAAVETLLWAATGGDVETVANTILLEASAQVKAQELFARLPEATRAQYGSADKLIALLIAKDAASLSGMQILGQRDISPDVVGVRVRIANDEGKIKEQGFAFQKTPDGLRLKVPDEAVDKFARQLGGGK